MAETDERQAHAHKGTVNHRGTRLLDERVPASRGHMNAQGLCMRMTISKFGLETTL